MAKLMIVLLSLLTICGSACLAQADDFVGVSPTQTILAPEQIASSGIPRVVIYTLPGCAHCKAAKQYMTENHIPFDNREVADNAGHLAELMKLYDEMGVTKAERGVPLIVVDGQTKLRGFNKIKLEKVLQAGAK